MHANIVRMGVGTAIAISLVTFGVAFSGALSASAHTEVDPHHNVTICYKGHTYSVSPEVAHAHYPYGATLGHCVAHHEAV